jgi:hypothetical protein
MPSQNFIPGAQPLPGPALGHEEFLLICIASFGIPTSRFVTIPDQPLTRRPGNQVTGLSIAAIDVNPESSCPCGQTASVANSPDLCSP